jgi:RecB family endonuclease NucS
MRIVVASCSAIYTGRGDTQLPKATRAIIIKNDGCVSIHNDKSNKPLNYMGVGSIFTETFVDNHIVWTFDTRKENLQIHLDEIISDTNFDVVIDDEGLVRDGTESQLQEWLSLHPETLGDGFTLVGREYPTGAGPVDLLVLDAAGKPVAVEVKRVAMLTAVDQANRYVEALKLSEEYPDVRGMVAALDIRPNTVKLADKRVIECVTIPADWRKIV